MSNRSLHNSTVETDGEPAGGSRRMPTVCDVAARAGVASATVSNVLTGRRPVREALQKRVNAAIMELGYQSNQLASSLRLRRSNTIGIIVPDIANPFFASLVHHIEDLAAHEGYDVLLADSNEDAKREAARLQTLLARQIDGLILAPSNDEIPALFNSRAGMPPTVLMDRGFGHAGIDSVTIDNAIASLIGCRHLIALGHREIAFVVSSLSLANMRERAEGYRDAMTAAGLERHTRVVEAGFDVDACHDALVTVLQARAVPSALFAATYSSTLGAMKAIRSMAIDFPSRMSLLGFDDSDWMTVLEPPLSVIEQPVMQIAANCWRLLRFRMQTKGRDHEHVCLPCNLIVRSSTRAPSRDQRIAHVTASGEDCDGKRLSSNVIQDRTSSSRVRSGVKMRVL